MLDFHGGISYKSSGRYKKKIMKNFQGSLEESKSVQTKDDAGFIPLIGVNPNPKGNAPMTEANHVLGLPLIVSP